MKIYSSREEIKEKEKWNLSDIYPTMEGWEVDYSLAENLAVELKHFDENIHNGSSLHNYLRKEEELSLIFNKVYVFAMLLSDLDTRDAKAQILLEKASFLSTKISSATSFFFPFLLELDKEKLVEYITEEPKLKYFENDLFEAYRFKSHVLNKDQQQLLSQLSDTFSSPRNTFGMLNNADMKFGEVTHKDNSKVELTRGMYSKLIEDTNREVRKEAFHAFNQPYTQLKNSFASTLSSAIKNNATLSKIKKYPSALEKSLFQDNIPKVVFDNLLQSARSNLPSLHKYNAIRKEKLGLEELHQYDMFVPLVENVELEFSYEEAYKVMLKALKPLGDEYIDALETFKDARYVDVHETPGKRSGAYNLGLYGTHPFVLLNHQNDLDSLFTLTHEMGHAMHSHLSNKNQPYISASYSIFVAEVASTVNEVLLINYLLAEAKDKATRKHLLNHFIDQFKGTFFTQVMFSEFEKKLTI